jgi:tetratricopeptide (TPR) repeat protein
MRKSLVKRSLVTYETGSSEPYLTIHRSLQRGILYKLDKQVESRQAVFEQAFSIVRQITPSASPIQVPNPRFWSEFEAAVPQIFALRSAFLGSQPQIEGSVQFAELLYDAGFNTWEREMSYSGLQLLETAEQILDDLGYDENAKLRADIHAIAGIICDNIGISRKAQGLLHRQKALKIRQMVVDEAGESVTRDQEILLYNAMNDVAESLLQSYGYQEAEVLVESCKVQYAKWGTEDEFPFEYGKYYRNIGAVRCLQRRFEEAITSTERAVELIGLDTGVGPRYLFYMYDSACHVLQAGDLETSLKIHREIFETREDVCGEFNDVTLQSAYTIGALYHHLGDPQMAEYAYYPFLSRICEILMY